MIFFHLIPVNIGMLFPFLYHVVELFRSVMNTGRKIHWGWLISKKDDIYCSLLQARG